MSTKWTSLNIQRACNGCLWHTQISTSKQVQACTGRKFLLKFKNRNVGSLLEHVLFYAFVVNNKNLVNHNCASASLKTLFRLSLWCKCKAISMHCCISNITHAILSCSSHLCNFRALKQCMLYFLSLHTLIICHRYVLMFYIIMNFM